MDSQKIKKGNIYCIVFIGIFCVFVFGFSIYKALHSPPFWVVEKTEAKPYTFGEYIYTDDANLQYELVYHVDSLSFSGIVIHKGYLNILVSQEPHIDYFMNGKDGEVDFVYQEKQGHIEIRTSRRYFTKSYHYVLSLYYDGYYLQCDFRSSDLKDVVDFHDEKQVIEEAKKYCSILIQLYEENKDHVRHYMNTPNQKRELTDE